MKKISSKIIMIYILMFLSLAMTVLVSYFASDTQQQHILLTDLLNDRAITEDRVILKTRNLSEIGVIDEIEFRKKQLIYFKDINNDIKRIDNILNSLENKSYILQGKVIKLKFREIFDREFTKVLVETKQHWKKTKSIITYLISLKNIQALENYKMNYEKFLVSNDELIKNSGRIKELCELEAHRKKNLSNVVQAISMFISFVILFALFFIIKNDFYKPLMEIKNIFKSMSKGELDKKFVRKSNDEFKQLYDNFNNFIDNLKMIFELEDKIITEGSIDEVMIFINENFKRFVPFEIIGLKFFSSNGKVVEKKVKNNIITTFEGENKFDLIKSFEIEGKNIYLPIIVNKVNLGYVYFEFEKESDIDKKYLNFIGLLSHKISLSFYKNILFDDLLSIVTNSLGEMAESKDPETGAHLLRMAMYSQIVAKKMSELEKYKDIITQEFIERILISAPMHDIGKVSIPDKILLKPGKLNDEEFKIMKTHAFAGGKILDKIHKKFKNYNIDYFKMAAEIAHSHQEKFNGLGYPNGLSKEKIPLSARIIAIADVFDALTSKRPYKEAFSLEKSYNIIKESKGTHFDPDIVDAFFDSKKEIEDIYNNFKEV